MFNFFGFKFNRKSNKEVATFVPPETSNDDEVIDASGGFFAGQLSFDTDKTEENLIKTYREMSHVPECATAIDEITNEAIVSDEETLPIRLNIERLDASKKLKQAIQEEFDNVCSLYNINWNAHELFRMWYIDGRIAYLVVVDEKNEKRGIIELRNLDVTKLKKVKELIKERDPKTGVELVKDVKEYYTYKLSDEQALTLSPDSVIFVTSGLLDESRSKTVSYLYRAIKPLNQLRMMEDSLVIYRLSRAPERRIFYIDIGNLSKSKAEEYMQRIMARYRNKLVYDVKTGLVKNDKNHMSMLEDFWLPRREGGRGTEISTLPGGQNLGEIDDILYFQKKLYKSLNVPLTRLNSEDSPMVSIGRATETTREELKFQKFINRLRKRFSLLFIEALKTQLILKGYYTIEEWEEVVQNFSIDFVSDSYFSELKETEIIRERISLLQELDSYIGTYYSKDWVRKNILRMTEEEIDKMKEQIDYEKKNEPDDNTDTGF